MTKGNGHSASVAALWRVTMVELRTLWKYHAIAVHHASKQSRRVFGFCARRCLLAVPRPRHNTDKKSSLLRAAKRRRRRRGTHPATPRIHIRCNLDHGGEFGNRRQVSGDDFGPRVLSDSV